MRRVSLLVFLLGLPSISAAAGNVQVSIDAEGDLVVIGDGSANGIDLWGYKGPPEEVRAFSGTTINGGPGPFVLPALRGRILVDLGAGDDRLDSTMRFPAGSVLRMGEGADRLTLDDVAGKNLQVDLGGGSDVLRIRDSGFGRLLVEAGAGNDVVEFQYSGADALAMRMGDGNDLLSLEDGYFEGSVGLHGGLGTDELEQHDNRFDLGPPKVVSFEGKSKP